MTCMYVCVCVCVSFCAFSNGQPVLAISRRSLDKIPSISCVKISPF